LAVVLSGDRGEAEELAQEAFAAAHGRWVDLQHYDNPVGWVRRVVANKAVSGHRRRLSETKGLRLLGARQSAGLPYGTEHRGELWAAVRDLPDRQAQAVALFYLGDRSVASVAELMDLSEGAVKSHLSRARKTLANRLGMEDEK
jgi:RNA polymerase sigma-70 factor (ECF subfamily)